MEEYIKQQNEDNRSYELSHLIGINTKIPKCMQSHSVMPETISYAVGGTLVFEDLGEKNNQVYFRHGVNQISAFILSNTGKYIAVGFNSISMEKNFPASIILWDALNKEIIIELKGVFKAVTHLEFSADDKFLLACGMDSSLSVWDIESGQRCYHRIYEFAITCSFWSSLWIEKNSKFPCYSILVANIQTVFLLNLIYDFKTMKYGFSVDKFITPLGFSRIYTCGVFDKTYGMLYLGSNTGELILFDYKNLLFKYSFNVIYNGVTSMVLLNDSSIIVGGGDGKVKRLIIENNKHVMTHEIQLDNKISSLSVITDEKEVVCLSSSGVIYRILTQDLTYTIHSYAHVSSVNDCCHIANDKCLTVDNNGNLCFWDFNNYNLLSKIESPDLSATSVTLGEDNTIFVGYSNGYIKNFSYPEFHKNWEISTHRGSVNCIYVDQNYILTGGEDGVLRIWTRTTRELTMQFPAHHKDVLNIFPHQKYPNLIYTCGADRKLNIFDLKNQKRINQHEVKNGIICSISQKIKPDYEVISCGLNNNVYIWDFHKIEPLSQLNLNENFYCIRISNNGEYLALGSAVGEIWFFKMNGFEFIGKSRGHSMELISLKWSPDDKQIVSVSRDGSVCVWNFYLIS